MDALADDEPDSRWMTVAELAESRQISKASAARLVRRRRWRRMPDNRGVVRVYVPVGEELPQEQPTDARADIPADGSLELLAIVSAKDEVVAAKDAHIGTLTDALTKAENRADDLQRQLDQWFGAALVAAQAAQAASAEVANRLPPLRREMAPACSPDQTVRCSSLQRNSSWVASFS